VSLAPREEAALRAVTRLNIFVFAVTFGVLGASGLALATLILVLAADNGRAHLSLLSIFLWGYRVTGFGALIGAVWGFIYGAILGALLYWGYARTLQQRLAYAAPGVERRRAFRTSVLRLHGPGLGFVLGSLAAVQLVLMTNWLVLRGTAEESMNAMLLAQYLPWYSVTPMGSIAGAVQLFAVVFLAAVVLAGIYNKIVDWRQSPNGRRG
jgi:hypothetical protein